MPHPAFQRHPVGCWCCFEFHCVLHARCQRGPRESCCHVGSGAQWQVSRRKRWKLFALLVGGILPFSTPKDPQRLFMNSHLFLLSFIICICSSISNLYLYLNLHQYQYLSELDMLIHFLNLHLYIYIYIVDIHQVSQWIPWLQAWPTVASSCWVLSWPALAWQRIVASASHRRTWSPRAAWAMRGVTGSGSWKWFNTYGTKQIYVWGIFGGIFGGMNNFEPFWGEQKATRSLSHNLEVIFSSNRLNCGFGTAK